MENLIEVLSIPEKVLNEIAIEEAIDGSILNIDKLIEDEEDVNLIHNFYRNVNLTNKF